MRHYGRAFDLARQFSDEDGVNVEIGAAANLATVHANRGDEQKALAILSTAAARLHDGKLAGTPENQMAAMFLADQQARHAMIGQPVPAITGKLWLNSAAGTSSQAMQGKVRILAFVAFWCDPCVNSYLPLMRLASEFPAADSCHVTGA